MRLVTLLPLLPKLHRGDDQDQDSSTVDAYRCIPVYQVDRAIWNKNSRLLSTNGDEEMLWEK